MDQNRDLKGYYFTVSSDLKDLIGQDLVTNKYVAILELVKNSYDAGSPDANVIFEHTEAKSGKADKIIIVDSGKGMTQQDIENKWLWVAYSDKKSKTYTPGSRIEAGLKGIGRFSCDKLGKKLDMYTKTKGDNSWHHLHVNWQDFENHPEREFARVPVRIEDSSLPSFLRSRYPGEREGTALVISEIRESWPYADLFELRNYLQRMINPFQAKNDFRIYLAAPSYKEQDSKERARNEEHENELLEMGEEAAFDEADNWVPHGPVQGEIENVLLDKVRARAVWITSVVENDEVTTHMYDHGKLLLKTVEKSVFNWIGRQEHAERLETEVFYLNRKAKNAFTRLMGIRPVNFGSIFIYKNAFRVFPYGEEGNDWLELDRSKGQGWRRALSTRDILGRVSIIDRTNTFREVSSRQGFVEGNEEPFNELKTYMNDFVINRLTRYVVEAINWDSEKVPVTETEKKLEATRMLGYIIGRPDNFQEVSLGPDFLDAVKEKEIQKVPELVKGLQQLTELAADEKSREYLQVQISSIKSGIKQLNRNLKESRRELMFYQKVTTAAALSAQFEHEIKNSTEVMQGALVKLSRILEKLDAGVEGRELVDLCLVRSERILELSRIGSMANFSTESNEITKNLVGFVVQYLRSTIEPVLEGTTLNFKGEDQVLVKSFIPMEVSIIFDNLASNSMKMKASSILVDMEVLGDTLSIRFSDDGPGVPMGSVAKLFTMGYSTTNGSGLGLYICRRVAERSGGSFEFVGNNAPNALGGACFEVRI